MYGHIIVLRRSLPVLFVFRGGRTKTEAPVASPVRRTNKRVVDPAPAPDFVEQLVEKDAVFYHKMKQIAKQNKARDEKFKDLGKKRSEEAKKKKESSENAAVTEGKSDNKQK